MATITVKVREHAQWLPIEGASVLLGGASGTTDINGEAEISGAVAGTYSYIVSAAGWKTRSGIVTVIGTSDRDLNVTMVPSIDWLPKKGIGFTEKVLASIIRGSFKDWVPYLFAPSWHDDSLLVEMGPGRILLGGRLVESSSMADLSVTLNPNSINYVYAALDTAELGLNVVGVSLIVKDRPGVYENAMLQYIFRTNGVGVTQAWPEAPRNAIFRHAVSYYDTLMPSPYLSHLSSANTERTVASSTEQLVKRFFVEHGGTVTILCELKRTTGLSTCYLNIYTTSGGGTPVATLTRNTDTYVEVYADIPVQPGDTISCYLRSSGSSVTAYIRNCKMRYKSGIPLAPHAVIN